MVGYDRRLLKRDTAVAGALADELRGRSLCPHSMPAELFGDASHGAASGGDLVEDGVLRSFRKLLGALERDWRGGG